MLLAFLLISAFRQLSCEALRLLDREDCELRVLMVRLWTLVDLVLLTRISESNISRDV